MKSIILILTFCAISIGAFCQTNDYHAKAKELVNQMTLEEKASLCSGLTAWKTKPIDRLSIPSIFMTDGPHGLRKAEGFDFTNSVPSTCFPTASALAASWNPNLAHRIGEALGNECQANDVQILLGPGVNMKRSPLGGRNFEYFSEDPLLAGKMAVAIIKGVQSKGVGTSLKHFAANNQEFERMTMSSDPDDRTLHEIYLPAFEMAVKEANPMTVMCSYNKVNGVYASENPMLLTDILRKQWGYKGIVVSDWGAVSDRVAGVKAGLNLEMPSTNGANDKKIVEAVNNGSLNIETLNALVTDMLAVTLEAKANHKSDVKAELEAHNQLAREASGECIVLLKNEKQILPLSAATKKIAVIGAFAKTPRYQGAGSSQVKPTQITNAYDALGALLGKSAELKYAPGYVPDADLDQKLIDEAVKIAKLSQIAIIFAGLPDSYESEGFDRKNINMPESHNRLIEAVAKVQPNVVVVLMNGSAVSMPWIGKVKGVLEAWLGGQAGGGAVADVLTGKVNPSGKLSETFPARIEDTPAFLDFPTKTGVARYGEGIFIGYRYYDKKQIKPLFPFGYGLSYSHFDYTDIKADKTAIKDNESLTIEVKVKNTSKISGKEVVELYVHDNGVKVVRPEKELRQFEKVSLKPGEEQTVRFTLGYRDFAYYNSDINDWYFNSGKFDILVGGSSQSLPLKVTVDVTQTKVIYPKLTRNSMLKEFAMHPKGKAIYDQMMGSIGGMVPPGAKEDESAKKGKRMMEAMLNDMPIYKMVGMSNGLFTEQMLDGIIQMVNSK